MAKEDRRNEFKSIMASAHLHRGNRTVMLALCDLVETFYIDGIISRVEYHEAMTSI